MEHGHQPHPAAADVHPLPGHGDTMFKLRLLGSIILDLSAWIYQLGPQSPVGVDEDLGGGGLVDADHGELRHLAQVPGLGVQVEQLDQSEISVQVT